jgi:hypothetical protein
VWACGWLRAPGSRRLWRGPGGLSGVLAALVADLSALSKAETERIWLTFGLASLPRRRARSG